ncbi:MAG: helix-turn-helix domain-containing protein [Pigmentiphaga sp.]
MQGPVLSFQTRAALRSIGGRIRTARLRRGDTEIAAATRAGVARDTWRRLEQGQPTISVGLFIEALVLYGFAEQVFELADPALDSVGASMDASRRPKRGRNQTTTQHGRDKDGESSKTTGQAS